jgi:uncharacterized protein (TIGR03083 family)
MSADLGAMYRQARVRLSALVDEAVAGLAVAATPGWDVHDVIAHLTGLADDAVNGNMAGAPGEAWTAAQVERGRGRSIADMVAGWAEHALLVEARLSSPEGVASGQAVADILTHECDIRTALGLPLDVPADALQWVAARMSSGFADQVASAGLPAVAVNASPIEVFRSRLGRRTVDEVRSYGWSLDPEPYLDHWFIFGRAERSLGERV